MADIISEFRKLPRASLGGCVKGWEAWTPSEVTLKHFLTSLTGISSLKSLQSEIKPPISPPYVGCIISNVSSTSGCVENTA